MFRTLMLAAAFAAMAASAARAAPLEVYGSLPSIEQIKLSPDGSRVAMILTDGLNRKILIKDVDKNVLTHEVPAGQTKVRNLTWAGPDHVIVTVTQTSTIMDVDAPRDEWAVALDFNLTTGRVHQLLHDAVESLNVILGTPEVRTVGGKPMVFLQGVHFESLQGRNSLFRVSLDFDKSRLLESGGRGTIDWLVSSDGKPLAQSLHDDQTKRWTLKVKAPTGWRESRVIPDGDDFPDLVGLGRDGQSILMRDYSGETPTLREVSPGGIWGEPLDLKAAAWPIFDPELHNLIGGHALVGDEDRYTFFDPLDQRAWNAVLKAYPGERVQLISWSNDRQRIVVLADSPTDGPAYALVDLKTHRGAWLGAQYGKLSSADVAPVKAVRFKAADGLVLSGYLTTPKGGTAKDLPLIVFPHGGPAARDEPGFDWWAQAMASRGYAVLQVNFRGSDGFGPNFLTAGYGQWGRKMQTDLSDGVRFLATQGVVDPKRVCIAGGSYGGYAALAGVTIDKGVYRCAASYGGVSDLRRQFTYSKGERGEQTLRFWNRYMGAKTLNDPVLAQYSPALLADSAAGPILLIHGQDDTVVPLSQSQAMADALKKAGKPVELVVLKGEDHWLSRGDTRLAMLSAMIAFLEKNNPPH